MSIRAFFSAAFFVTFSLAAPALTQVSSAVGSSTVPQDRPPGGWAQAVTNVRKVQLATTGYTHDIGSSTNSWGGGTATTCWIHAFTAGGNDAINEISTAYGTPTTPTLPNGLPTTVLLYDDPDDDGDPSNAVLLWSLATTTVNANTDTMSSYAVQPSVPVSGVFFIAVATTHGAGQFPAPMDETQTSSGRAWMCRSVAGAFNPNDLSANAFPPTDMDELHSGGAVWMLRANTCEDDGTGVYCTSAATTNGVSDISSDLLEVSISAPPPQFVLSADNLPLLNANCSPGAQPGIFIASPCKASIPFFNGTLCVSPGGLQRMCPLLFPDAGGVVSLPVDLATQAQTPATAPNCPGAPIQVKPGFVHHFQYWTRDPCALNQGQSDSANFSSAIGIAFVP